jgi:hypothetical protein
LQPVRSAKLTDPTVTPIIEFYRLEGTDSERRTLQSYWKMTDDEMEYTHDFIQWMFPLRDPSSFNPDAPLLTDDDIDAFHRDSALQSALRRSFERFLQFLGLQSDGDIIRKAPNFPARVPTCWIHLNHNWLRITRCLTSLRLLGLTREAAALFACLTTLKSEGLANEESFTHWNRAARD